MTELEHHGVRMLSGRCWCDAVRYTVEDAFLYAGNCHCPDCRRKTGSAFKPFAGIERHKLTVTKGSENLSIIGDDSQHDAHCRLCCSLLYSVVREGAYIHVAMGTLSDDPSIRAREHIFVGSKAPWFTITDDIPQYERHVADAKPAATE